MIQTCLCPHKEKFRADIRSQTYTRARRHAHTQHIHVSQTKPTQVGAVIQHARYNVR